MHQGTAVPASEPANADAGPVRVLYVDDDASHRNLARSFLAREGDRFAVETAPDVEAGRERLAEGGIDCIVSDYGMSGTDGLEFLEAVREDHSEIPFVLFTGKGSERIASEAISAGVTDYLPKGGPEQYRVLANRIEEITGCSPETVEGCLVDVTRHREREAKIRGLQGRMDDLIRAESRGAVAEVAIEAAEDALDLPSSGIHLVSGDTLEPVAVTDTVREELGEVPTYYRTDPDRSIDRAIWAAFERDEPLVVEDVSERPELDLSETPTRSGIVHPLGDHGVFITSSPEPDAFDDTDEALFEILATTVRATLDRTDGGFYRGPATETERVEEFVGVLGHDLRNPLSVAAGHLEFAREDGGGEHVANAARAVERIGEIVEDTLALARGGEVVEDFERVRIDDLATRCWRTVETGDAILRVESDVVVLADRSRLAQVFENLFRNAVEHGGSEIRVGDLAEGFYVEDDGDGIDPSDRERVFDVGYSTEGIGLGLRIVREIVAAHGWEVAVHEGAEGGARFEITDVPLR